MLRSTPPPKWLWIGNSNTRPYVTQFDNDFRMFKLCTKIEQYKTEIENAPDNCDFLTLSGIDTIIADLGVSKNAEELEAEMDILFSHLDSYRQHGMKIVIEPLLPWKKHPDHLRRAAVSAFKTLKSKFPGLLIPPKPDFLKFSPDGVHLTDRAGSKLFKLMYELSKAFFEEKEDCYQSGMDTDGSETSDDEVDEIEIVDTEEGNSKKQKLVISKSAKRTRPFHPKPSVSKKSKNMPSTVNLEDEDDDDEGNTYSFSHPGFKKLVKALATLKTQVERRWSVDLLVSAGTKEDLDKIENERNMNKIVFTGIEIHDLWAADLTWALRLEKIKKAITDFIKIIDEEGTYDLGYTRHLNYKLKATRQIFEVTMGDESQAKGLRKAYGAKVKTWRENKDFPDTVKGTSIGPSLTLATRVRIAILHAIAKEIKSSWEDTEAWVIQHVARPVLKVETGSNNDNKSIATMGFAQSIAYFKKECPHSNLSSQDLYDAYSITGNRFGNEIDHYFVILDQTTARNFALKKKPRSNKNQNNQKSQKRS